MFACARGRQPGVRLGEASQGDTGRQVKVCRSAGRFTGTKSLEVRKYLIGTLHSGLRVCM